MNKIAKKNFIIYNTLRLTLLFFLVTVCDSGGNLVDNLLDVLGGQFGVDVYPQKLLDIRSEIVRLELGQQLEPEGRHLNRLGFHRDQLFVELVGCDC